MTDSKVDYAQYLSTGRQLLDSSEVEKCVAYLVPVLQQQEQLDGLESAKTDGLLLETMQLAGEALLELGNPQDAYPLFQKCSLADPTGERGGFEKFLWLGQLTGSREGIEFFKRGIEGLTKDVMKNGKFEPDTPEILFKRKRIADAYCGIVEIWMTDLW